METLQEKILRRYFRKTKAHPDGAVVHHGDCDVFSLRVCTCGLHNDLKPASAEFVDQHYPGLYQELADYERVRDSLMHPVRKRK